MDTPKTKSRRSYNSPARRQQTVETQQKIIDAGAELVKKLPSWDWRNISFREISKLAGVSERTIYRYFSNESKLRDAIISKLIDDSGIENEHLSVDNFGRVIARMFTSLSTFSARIDNIDDPKFISIANARHEAIMQAVADRVPLWNPLQQRALSALMDMLWNPSTYERCVSAWGLSDEETIQSIAWLMDLMINAIETQNPPLKSE